MILVLLFVLIALGTIGPLAACALNRLMDMPSPPCRTLKELEEIVNTPQPTVALIDDVL